MKLRGLLALLVVAALSASAAMVTAADKEEKKFEAKCLVSGAPAKEDKVVEYKGKKLYFCCDNCPKAYAKDPEKFAAKAHHQLASTEQIVQVDCPYSGKAINPESVVEIAGVKVGFCCNNCKGKTEKASAEEQLEMVFADVSKGFTFQTECPVSGGKIDPSKRVEYKGKKVFFCCENCPAGFEKEPEKFLSKLPQFAEEEK